MQEAFFDEAVDAAGAMMRGAAAEVLVAGAAGADTGILQGIPV